MTTYLSGSRFGLLRRTEYKTVKLIRKARREFLDKRELRLKTGDLRKHLSDVRPIALRRAEIYSSVDKSMQPLSTRTSVSGMAYQRSEVGSQTWREGVNAVFGQLCIREKRAVKVGNRHMHLLRPGTHPGLQANCTQGSSNALQSDRENGDFVQEQPANNPRGFLPQRYGFAMLPRGDSRRLFSDRGCALRSAIGRERYSDRSAGGKSTHYDRSPVSHVPPINRERAYRHLSSFPSTLEPILP